MRPPYPSAPPVTLPVALAGPRAVISLARPTADLTWLRLRIPTPAASPVAALVRARLAAAALPGLSVGRQPLHHRLARVGAVLEVDSDPYGALVRVTSPTGEVSEVVDLLAAASTSTVPGVAGRAARDDTAASWNWERHDSEALGDLLADLCLHATPHTWPTLYDELDAAMGVEPEHLPGPSLAAGGRRVVVVGPPGAAELVAPLADTTDPNGSDPDVPDPDGGAGTDRSAGGRLARDLDVTGDGSVLLRAGWRIPPRTDAAFAPLAVAARLVGGHYRSRLMREFRAEQGWSYSPWALARSGRTHGLWQVSVRVPVAHRAAAVERVRAIVAGCDPDPAEHAEAVAHTVAELRTLWSTGDSVLSLLGYWQDLGLPATTERDRWLAALAGTGPDDVSEAVKAWLGGEPDVLLAFS
ncbi:insulinase family protein [Micromonospora sp. LOL_021]|uniref:insulinase family protein n=1 Tax=Micromonospora sp. LOL_021 TaxID=3345417 RepID=UPI003A873CD0